MVEIRMMTKEDIPRVTEIHRAITRSSADMTEEMDLELEFMDLMGTYPEGCLVAHDKGNVVGFIIASLKHWGFGLGTSGWIELVGVHPDHMGGGVGKALGAAVLDHFEQVGICDVYTAVRWDHADMITFFKSIGFGRSEFINLKHSREDCEQ